MTPPKLLRDHGPTLFDERSKDSFVAYRFTVLENGDVDRGSVTRVVAKGGKYFLAMADHLIVQLKYEPASQDGVPTAAPDRYAAFYSKANAYGRQVGHYDKTFDHDETLAILADFKSVKDVPFKLPNTRAYVRSLRGLEAPETPKWGAKAYSHLTFKVTKNGRPTDVEILEADHDAFAKQARKSLSKAYFMPAVIDHATRLSDPWHAITWAEWSDREDMYIVHRRLVPERDLVGLTAWMDAAKSGESPDWDIKIFGLAGIIDFGFTNKPVLPDDFPVFEKGAYVIAKLDVAADGSPTIVTALYTRGDADSVRRLTKILETETYRTPLIHNRRYPVYDLVLGLVATPDKAGGMRLRPLKPERAMKALAKRLPEVAAALRARASETDLTVTEVKPLVRTQPEYPVSLARRRVSGFVTVELMVDEMGHTLPQSVKVINSSGQKKFEDASKKAATLFRYKPLEIDGQAVLFGSFVYHFTFDISS